MQENPRDLEIPKEIWEWPLCSLKGTIPGFEECGPAHDWKHSAGDKAWWRICIYIYICIYVYVFIYGEGQRERGRERKRDEMVNQHTCLWFMRSWMAMYHSSLGCFLPHWGQDFAHGESHGLHKEGTSVSAGFLGTCCQLLFVLWSGKGEGGRAGLDAFDDISSDCISIPHQCLESMYLWWHPWTYSWIYPWTHP